MPTICMTVCKKLGYELSSHISPVVPVIIGSKEDGLRIWRELISLGVYVNLILPPAAPAGHHAAAL